MGHGEGRAGGRNTPAAAEPKRPASERLRDLWPDIWELVRVAVGAQAPDARLSSDLHHQSRFESGAALSPRNILIDNVIGKRQIWR